MTHTLTSTFFCSRFCSRLAPLSTVQSSVGRTEGKWNHLRSGGVCGKEGVSRAMKVLILVLLGSFALGDLEQKEECACVHISEALGNRLVAHRVQPVCPDACSLCEHAEVKLKLLVSKSGTVKRATPISGDWRLAEAATDAVKQWRYERYVLQGAPVEYETYTTVKSWLCRS